MCSGGLTGWPGVIAFQATRIIRRTRDGQLALAELKKENMSERDVDSKSTGDNDCVGLMDVEDRETKVDTLISTEMRADLRVGEYEVKLGTLSLRGG